MSRCVQLRQRSRGYWRQSESGRVPRAALGHTLPTISRLSSTTLLSYTPQNEEAPSVLTTPRQAGFSTAVG